MVKKVKEADEGSIGKEILYMAKALSNEKDVSEQVIFEAIELALASVAAREYEENSWIRVSIDQSTGSYESFRCWDVVEDDSESFESPARQLLLTGAKALHGEDIVAGDVIEESIPSVSFGRIAAQQAKQVILQKVREAERAKIAQQYVEKVGELINGVVTRVTHDFILLDMGANAEAVLKRDQMMPREACRMNDRLRVYLMEVQEEKRGPQLLVSRSCPEFLVELFKIEVPEIGEEVIEIMAAARDAGSRAKIAVKTNDGRVDPIGACVGMRGARVQAVSNELGGERVDIVLWDDNPAQLVINAMAPAEVASIVVDEESHTIDVAVAEDQLPQAIGRGGQNVRLASELTGWKLNVMTEEDAVSRNEGEVTKIKAQFKEILDVDDEIAELLVAEGFTRVEEVAYIPTDELLAIASLDNELAEELKRRANDYLFIQEIAGEADGSSESPAQDLLDLPGMDEKIASTLASNGIVTREDLAELAVDEVLEFVEIDEKAAAELIMAARASWFTEDE